MIHYLNLGQMDYSAALDLQLELAELRYQGRIPNTLLLVEHPAVLTLGRNATRANILASDALLAQRNVQVLQIKRGGDVTYHGPGQLVGYPIFDLRSLAMPGSQNNQRLGPVDFVRLLEEVLIRLTGHFQIPAGRIPGLTGVWCGLKNSAQVNEVGSAQHEVHLPQAVVARKIAAIGIHVSRGIVTHGFAYNLSTNLDDFRLINPCGITDKPVTSLAHEYQLACIANPLPTIDSLANNATRLFGQVLNQPILAIESLQALRAMTLSASNPEIVEPAIEIHS